MFDFFKKIFGKKETATQKKGAEEKPYEIDLEKAHGQKIISIWEVLKCNDNTQAFHLVSVIPFDMWIDMDEIRRRIWDLFQIEYQNERSLYPYLKTMVDLGLVETSNIGGKRKWRKKDLLIKIEEEEKEKEEITLKQTNK